MHTLNVKMNSQSTSHNLLVNYGSYIVSILEEWNSVTSEPDCIQTGVQIVFLLWTERQLSFSYTGKTILFRCYLYVERGLSTLIHMYVNIRQYNRWRDMNYAYITIGFVTNMYQYDFLIWNFFLNIFSSNPLTTDAYKSHSASMRKVWKWQISESIDLVLWIFFWKMRDNVTTGPACVLNLGFRSCSYCGHKIRYSPILGRLYCLDAIFMLKEV